MYEGPFGLPFILEDRTGSLTDTTLSDIYGRLTIKFEKSMDRPDRSVTMIRVIDAPSNSLPLVPNAVLDFGFEGTGKGSVMFPPNSNIPMESYVKKMAPSDKSGVLCRKWVASDGQEYKWTLVQGDKIQWTCSTSKTNYFVASYEQIDDAAASSGESRAFSVADTWVHLVVELLTSLTVVRHICLQELGVS